MTLALLTIILALVTLNLAVLVLILASKSPKSMNLYTILNAFAGLVAVGYTLISEKLPIYFLSNNYLFIDTLSAYEILISSIIFLLAAIYARGYVDSLIKAGELNPRNTRAFYVSFNLLFVSVILVFCSNNLALFWIFAEITTLLSAVLIVFLNAKENIAAAIKYIFIASTAMLFSFVGIIFLFAISKYDLGTATLNWDLLLANAEQLSPGIFALSLILIFIGFASKSGIAPFHTWLPIAHSKAPSDVSAILSGSVINIGMYGIIRIYALAQHTSIQPLISTVFIFFGVLTVAIAALSMVVRTNVKKLIAFSSVENMGFILVGIGIGNGIALFWVLFHTLAHALSKALLFFSSGIVHHQYNDTRIEFIHDLIKFQPLASWGLILGTASIIGMPLFPLFISKFFILFQLWGTSKIILAITLSLLLIVAASFVIFLINLFGRTKDKELPRYNAPLSMKAPIIVLVIVLIILGVFIPLGLKQVLDTIILQLGL
jgi:hydrogenase-4 component F